MNKQLSLRLSDKKRNTIIEIISALFILLFVYTAVSKLSEFDVFKFVLKETPLIGGMNTFVAWAIPISELLISLLLFIPRTRVVGLFGATILMTLFTLYLGYMIVFEPNLPCNCGGVIKKMTWPQHLVFNICFTGIGLTGILMAKIRRRNNEEQFAQVIYT